MTTNHFDDQGNARMVDVSGKAVTTRTATAEAIIVMNEGTMQRIADRSHRKGDVLTVARLAAIMATKHTETLIPLCHAIPIEAVDVAFDEQATDRLVCRVTVRTSAKTGVEMEAMTAASVAALTVYDMCKSVDRGMEILSVRLLAKSGGRSGDFRRTPEQ
ncbi:MAG: cyclic pyranopterin monophosphate synthase MoaC [Pirellulaceae bacterium]